MRAPDSKTMLTLTRAMPHCATRPDRFRDALGTGGAPALFPSPSLLAFTNTHRRNRKRDYRIKPPHAEESVRRQPDQHRAGEDGAQDVLRPLAVGGARTELFADALLSSPKPRAKHERTGCQGDAEPTGFGGCPLDQSLDRFSRDITVPIGTPVTSAISR